MERGATREEIDAVYRSESPRVLSTLIRLVGDFDLAEDALHDAFSVALQRWPKEGVPANPRAWLISTGRFKAVDTLRRESRLTTFDESLATEPPEFKEEMIQDDLLRLVFCCCHPALPSQGQVALTLREVCGLTTDEIARAFLATPVTVAQRIVRAKAKIRDDKIPYEIPASDELPGRLDNVLRVTYLVFNEGYYSSSGETLTRVALSNEAIRLGRLLVELLPGPETRSLLALMLLNESRREARATPTGDVILLEDQDRSLWNREMIDEGLSLISHETGPYALQASIVAVHASAKTAAETDWGHIVSLYDTLLSINPSPVIALNRAVAVAMNEGLLAGLALVDELLAKGGLNDYGLAHSARADLCRRAGMAQQAKESYRRALALATLEPERRFLSRRLKELP